MPFALFELSQEVGVDHGVAPLVQRGWGPRVGFDLYQLIPTYTFMLYLYERCNPQSTMRMPLCSGSHLTSRRLATPRPGVAPSCPQRDLAGDCICETSMGFARAAVLRSFNQIMLGQVGGAAPARFPPTGDEWLEKAGVLAMLEKLTRGGRL